MQLIVHLDITGFDAWKTAFVGDAESRRDAGLTVLQVWKDADSDTRGGDSGKTTTRGRIQY